MKSETEKQPVKNPSTQSKMTKRKKMSNANGHFLNEVFKGGEKQYRQFLDALQEGIWVIDEETRTIFVNPRMAEMLGYTEEEMLGKRMFEFMDAQGVELTEINLERCRQGRKNQHEFELLRKDETRIFTLVETSPLTDEEGNYTGAIAGVTEITQHKQVEEALRESSQLLETILDHTHMLVAYMDRQFNFVKVNRAYAKADEREPSFFPGKNHFDLYPNTENEEIFKRVVETGELYFAHAKPFEYAEHPERRVSYWDWSLVPIKDHRSTVIGLVLTLTNVTERFTSQEALRVRSRELRERVKELNCLLGIAKLVEVHDLSLEEILQGTAELLPPAWQYPEITCARIIMDEREYGTDNFRKSVWKQTADIVVHGRKKGAVEVCYMEKKPDCDEGPFVREERSLINAVAERLGRIAERKEAEVELQRYRKHLEDLVNEKTTELRETNTKLRLEIIGREKTQQMLKQRVSELESLNAISREAGVELSVQQVVQVALDEVMRVAEPDLVLMYMMKDDSLLLQGLRSSVDTFSREKAEVHNVGECLCGLAAQKREPQYSTDIDHDSRCTLPECKEAGFRSFAALPLLVGQKLLGILGIASVERGDFSEQHTFWDSLTNEIAIRLQNVLLYEKVVFQTAELKKEVEDRLKAENKLLLSQQELRELAMHLQSVRESERTHIAREIHDELGQDLTALKMDISWLQRRIETDQKPIMEKLKVMTEMINATIQMVKKISTELRPGLLDDLGIVAAVDWQVREFHKRTGITYELGIKPEFIDLDKDRSTALFRILQEALTNIVRHSGATKIIVNLDYSEKGVEMMVWDNGRGILDEELSNARSFGLIGMRERASFFGGELIIKGIPGEGTKVIASFPLGKAG